MPSTVDFYLRPEDSWVQVVNGGGAYLEIKASQKVGFAVYADASAPVTTNTKATATFDFSGQPSAGEMFSVGGLTKDGRDATAARTYRYFTTTWPEVATANIIDVSAGANQAASANNAIAAINGRAATAATGTITLSSTGPVAAETVTVNGVELEFVSANPSTNEVLIGGSITATGDNLAAVINGVAAVAASGTITISSTGPAENDTVTVAGHVFSFETAEDGAPYTVVIGGSIGVTADNLARKIRERISYVNAVAAAGVVTITARVAGAAGNAITLTESATNTVVSGSGTLTGGVTAVAAAVPAVTASNNAGTVTITAVTAGYTGNAITLAESATNTVVSGAKLTGGLDATTAHPQVIASNSSNDIVFTAIQSGDVGNSIPISEGLSNVTFSAVAFAGAALPSRGMEMSPDDCFKVTEPFTEDVFVRLLPGASGDILPVHFAVYLVPTAP